MTALRVTLHAVITRDGTPEHPWQTRCDLCTDEQIHTDPNLGALAVNTRGVGNRDAYRATAAALLHYEKAHPDHRCDQCTIAPEPYPWPCSRRDAHKAHHVHEGGGAVCYHCPGLPAHPATMAGGNHHNTRPEGAPPA